MSLENVGIGGVLIFNPAAAVTGMNQAAAATANLSRTQGQLKASTFSVSGAMDSLAGGVGKLGVAFTPFSAAMGLGIKEAADFEKQMSAVKSVAGASADDMALLTQRAKELGATTVFDPKEVGLGMEELARAGFDAQEILSSIGGVMSAAAADTIPLATATEIVATTIRGMGLEAKDATRVADVLALTSAKTSSSMTTLGESMKYAVAQARTLKIDLETTAGLLGVAADAGLKGSIGGTSFAHMLQKLSKPSKEANAWMTANNIQMTKTAEGGLDVVNVLKQIHTKVEGESDVMKKSAIAFAVFGDRGAKAFNAISTSIDSGKLDRLIVQLRNAKGAAAEMAATRLDNFLGGMKLLGNTIKAFAIESFGMFLKPLGGNVHELGKALGDIVVVMQRLNAGLGDEESLSKEFGTTIVAIASGIRQGFATAINAFQTFRSLIIETMLRITGDASPNLIENIAKWATMFFLVAGAIAPILVALSGVLFFISSVVIPTVEGLVAVFTTLGPAILGVGAIFGIVYAGMSTDTETFGETTTRMWNTSGMLANWYLEQVQYIGDYFSTTLSGTIESLKLSISNFLIETKAQWQQSFGAMAKVVEFLAPLFSAVFKILAMEVSWAVKVAVGLFQWWLGAITPVASAIKELALFLVEHVINNLQRLVKIAVKAADAMHLTNGSQMWADLAFFASQPPIDLTSRNGKLGSIAEAQKLGMPEPPTVDRPLGDDAFAKLAADNVATMKAMAAKPPPVNVGVNVEDKRQLDIKNCMTVDGRSMAVATAQHKQEINERAGFRATPWQRRQIMEQGAAPTGGVAGGGI